MSDFDFTKNVERRDGASVYFVSTCPDATGQLAVVAGVRIRGDDIDYRTYKVYASTGRVGVNVEGDADLVNPATHEYRAEWLGLHGQTSAGMWRKRLDLAEAVGASQREHGHTDIRIRRRPINDPDTTTWEIVE